MLRCIEIAKNGLGTTRPNPMVGCVIVYKNRIIGEGFTSPYGGSHAEVNAIASVRDVSLLNKATLYVTLEPCSHFGKTPPCANLIVKNKIPRVVIGTIDSHALVNGKGIAILEKNGIQVSVSILSEACRKHHKRFFTFHEKKRPYIILKWAQSSDGFIDIDRTIDSMENAVSTQISNTYTKSLVHLWRAQEQAIFVGTNTVLKDNPSLNVREVSGNHPTRVIIDRNLRIPTTYNCYQQTIKTIIFTEKKPEGFEKNFPHIHFAQISFDKDLFKTVCIYLYQKNIQSLFVEGGKQSLQSFIDGGLWDEARVFTSKETLHKGIAAPSLYGAQTSSRSINNNHLQYFIPKC